MEGLQKSYNPMSKIAVSASPSTQFPEITENLTRETALGSGALINRAPRTFSFSTYSTSKLCACFFVAGVFVGFTLKRRVKRWASKLLRRLKDD